MPFILGVSFYTIFLEGIFKRYFAWEASDKNDIFFGTENMKESLQIFSAKRFIS